jgi:hypothetical protein
LAVGADRTKEYQSAGRCYFTGETTPTSSCNKAKVATVSKSFWALKQDYRLHIRAQAIDEPHGKI